MPSHDVYQVITDRIILLLVGGTVPWHKPWNSATGLPKNLSSGKPYRGINVMLLGCQHYTSPWWVTFRQCSERGGNVRKGEKATPVVFWSQLHRQDDTEAEGNHNSHFVLRYYHVFNAAQCDGLAYPQTEPTPQEFPPIETCEQLVAGMPKPPVIVHHETQAYYRPSADRINMPPRTLFAHAEEYYSTLFHELTHSTGHTSRLNRPTLTDLCPFGTTNYSKEELCAEMGAAYLCGLAGIENATIDNSAAYLQGWLRKLGSEPKLLVQAAAQAQKAVDYITNAQAVPNV
jgi:antirestriction protein ArdC